MISPDEFDEIAFRIVRGAEEAYVGRIIRRLVSSLVQGGALTARDYNDIATLARSNHEALQGLAIRYRARINQDVAKAVRDALEASSANDLALLASEYPSVAPIAATKLFHQISAQTVEGVQSIIARQNIALVSHAEKLWYEVAGDAVTAWNHGLGTMDQILSKSVKRLTEGSLSYIDYKSGRKTSLDAAVRRHVVSQIGQASGRITMGYMEEYEHDLVMTSAHFGARLEHEVWQGKAFSLNGRKTIGGITYPDFYRATEYGSITGLLGVNCRHSFGPFYPGITELPQIEETRNGMTSGEYYQATQKQRYYERQIRHKKESIAHGREAGLKMTQERLELNVLQGKLRTFVSSKGLVRNPMREKAYGIVGKQPIGLRVPPKHVASGGYGSKDWLAQFKEEELWITAADGSLLYYAKGDVNGVTFPKSLNNKYPFHNTTVKHTHTTSIGGTFSKDDIVATTRLNLKKHEIDAPLTEEHFVLERLPFSNRELRTAFRDTFSKYENERFFVIENEYYEKYCKPHELPVSNTDYRKIDRLLKGAMDKWLRRNALSFGYKYTSK